jgi:hypothetical protein
MVRSVTSKQLMMAAVAYDGQDAGSAEALGSAGGAF